MTEIALSCLDWAILLFEMLIAMVIFAIVKGWYDNRKWENHIYQILEEYRAKYGVDSGCELLLYRKINNEVEDDRKRFKSMIICNGVGEFQYIKIKDKRYSNNHITYHISSDYDLDFLLNSLNEDIVDLRNKRKPLWCKIKERIFGCEND